MGPRSRPLPPGPHLKRVLALLGKADGAKAITDRLLRDSAYLHSAEWDDDGVRMSVYERGAVSAASLLDPPLSLTLSVSEAAGMMEVIGTLSGSRMLFPASERQEYLLTVSDRPFHVVMRTTRLASCLNKASEVFRYGMVSDGATEWDEVRLSVRFNVMGKIVQLGDLSGLPSEAHAECHDITRQILDGVRPALEGVITDAMEQLKNLVEVVQVMAL